MKRIREAERLLRQLGINGSYCGLQQTAYAISLVMEDRGRLEHITKGLYLDVAREFQTGWKNVERNIRTISEVIWRHGERGLLMEISKEKLKHKPANTEFLDILAAYLLDWEAKETGGMESAAAFEGSLCCQEEDDSQGYSNRREIIMWFTRRIVELEAENARLKETVQRLNDMIRELMGGKQGR